MQCYRFTFAAMGGENELSIHAKHSDLAHRAAQEVINEVRRIESKFSRYRPDSTLSKLNSTAGKCRVQLDSETAGLLDYADACYAQSDGMFDITSGALRRAWNFRDKRLPKVSEIEPLRTLVGWNRVHWKNPYLYLPCEGMELDFGGIGKEYAVDRAAAVLLDFGTPMSLINLSGDIRICGARPGNIPWRVGVADPRQAQTLLCAVDVHAGAVATSGDYERRIEVNGKRYSHILSPKTGWPVDGVQSVTVFADSCLIAGSLTTTAMLQGKHAEEYLKELGAPYILVTSGGAVRCSHGLKHCLPDRNTASARRGALYGGSALR